jgi:hypothetical protein
MALLVHHHRRTLGVLAGILFLIFLLYHNAGAVSSRVKAASPVLGPGKGSRPDSSSVGNNHDGSTPKKSSQDENPAASGFTSQPKFVPGNPGPKGTEYTRTLVVPRLMREDVKWISEQLPDMKTAIYVVDLPTAKLHPPKNKGHEAMVYLTYIIDNYEDLPDISIFMHAHRYTWHNIDLLDNDAAEMVKTLSSEHVIRKGYVNLRCAWAPGCPGWLHPGTTEFNEERPEEVEIAGAWMELFPGVNIPSELSQPCCSQFALSRERVLSRPLSHYTAYRDWLLRTPLSDFLSGRIFEYSWQYLFAGEAVLCPTLSECYCDGFGFCFGGEKQIQRHMKKRERLQHLDESLREWIALDRIAQDTWKESGGDFDEMANVVIPEPGRDKELRVELEKLEAEVEQEHEDAVKRGKDPKLRAQEVGREWKEGDGF